ncbi:MAG: VOC family protein, partial [Verrucomicrobiota bacterium]
MTSHSSRWTLWRQDDNGSSAIISRHLEKNVATTRMAELEARGDRQHYWIEEEVSQTRLNLVVIRSNDLEGSRAFYELIGLPFTRHQHGDGAGHYASETPSFVFEIYPTKDRSSVGARIGFEVESVDEVVERMQAQGFTILSQPRNSPWGR